MKSLSRASAVSLAALTLVVAVTACSSSKATSSPSSTSSSPASSTTPTPTEPAPTPSSGPVVPVGAEYVALGSSYASGVGIATATGTCQRSDHNYAHLVAADLRLKLTDATCIAATTPNALSVPEGSQPPQVTAVTADTRLVTITLGGNDVGYAPTAIACGQANSTCVSSTSETKLDADFKALPASLEQLIAKIRATAPAAVIVLVTYVRLVPPTTCTALHYSAAATKLVASIGTRLEAVFVQVAQQTHIDLADPYVIGADHGPCAVGDARWVAGLQAPNGFPYHPTAAGHVEMAKLVEAALSQS